MVGESKIRHFANTGNIVISLIDMQCTVSKSVGFVGTLPDAFLANGGSLQTH